MSVTALSTRSGRHTSHPSGPGRATASTRRGAPVTATPTIDPVPALTVTFAIPLTSDAMTPQAHRLLEIVRELVELGHGSVTLAPADDTQPAVDTSHPWPGPPDDPDTDPSGLPAAHAERAQPAAVDPDEVRLLTGSRQVLLGGVPQPMTRLEFDLLLFLADNPRRVFSRMQLLTAVWGYEHTGERTVDVHVRRLRVKMGVNVPLITTVYGVGYRLADDAKLTIVTNA